MPKSVLRWEFASVQLIYLYCPPTKQRCNSPNFILSFFTLNHTLTIMVLHLMLDENLRYAQHGVSLKLLSFIHHCHIHELTYYFLWRLCGHINQENIHTPVFKKEKIKSNVQHNKQQILGGKNLRLRKMIDCKVLHFTFLTYSEVSCSEKLTSSFDQE